MEDFFYEHVFCRDISDLMDALDIDEDDLKTLPDNWEVKVMNTSLEPMFKFDKKDIVALILEDTDRFEDRFSEDSEAQMQDIENAISAGITRNDLIEYCK